MAYIEMPGIFWRATDGSAYAIIWRDHGRGQPSLEVAGRDWDCFVDAMTRLGLEGLPDEDSINDGFGPDQRPFRHHGPEFSKRYQQRRYEHSTQDWRVVIEGNDRWLFVDFCERLGIEQKAQVSA